MNQMISVLIPVYNRQDYIEECIRSVQAQTYGDFEILLIDDGSSDETIPICRRLMAEDPRIRLHCMAHGGISAARNHGLDIARGEYVFFLDSDDIIHPQLLEALVTGLQTTDAAIAATLGEKVPEARWHTALEKCQEPGPGRTTYQDHPQTLYRLFMTNSPLGIIGGVMMRRELIGNTRFRHDLFIGEDYFFIYENLIKGAASIFLEQNWYFNRLHHSNSSWIFDFSGFMNRFYRRELVWKSEEALGRTQYANNQKSAAFSIFLSFLRKKTMSREDKAKMRYVMKDYRKTLLPALSAKAKACYLLCVYLPFTTPAILWLVKKLDK